VDEVLPPVLLDVVLQLDSQGAVIVEAVEAVVNVRRRKHEAPALAEAHLALVYPRQRKKIVVEHTHTLPDRQVVLTLLLNSSMREMISKLADPP
jgi:hypothetical protein